MVFRLRCSMLKCTRAPQSARLEEQLPVSAGNPGAPKEETKVGTVSLGVWLAYLQAVGAPAIITSVLLTCSWVAVSALAGFWLVFWVNNSLGLSNITYMWTWLLLNVGFIALYVAQTVVWVMQCGWWSGVA